MLFSKRDLTRLIVPLLIEQTLALTIGMLDAVMVAQAGEAAVSGVSLVDSVNLLFLYFLGSVATGGAITISQFLGANDLDNARKSASQLIWVPAIFALVISLAMEFSRKGLLSLVFGSVTPEIMASAQAYFFYTVLSYPFIAIYNSGAAIYRAMGNSKVSMYASIVMNLLNVSGNAILIFVFRMGAAGAAIATLFSRVVGACIMMYLVRDKRQLVHVDKLFKFKPDFKLIKRMLGIGIPNGFEGSVFQLGKVITQSLVSTFGTVAIAANAAANTLSALLYIPGNAVGPTMTAVVGRCVGAGEKEQAKKYARKLLGIAYLLIISMSVVLSIASKPLVGMFNLSVDSTTLAIYLFVFHNICVSTVWPVAFTLPNSFRAASDVKYTMILSIVSMWIFRVGGSFFFGKYLGLGVAGVWYGMACDWTFRCIIFGIRYLRGTWLTKYKKMT